MNHEKYDKNLRAKFDAYAPNVDEAEMWKGIESALPQKKKRRIFFFPLIIFGLIGGVFLLGYFRYSGVNNTLSPQEDSLKTRPENLAITSPSKSLTPSFEMGNRTNQMEVNVEENEKINNTIVSKVSELKVKATIKNSNYASFPKEPQNLLSTSLTPDSLKEPMLEELVDVEVKLDSNFEIPVIHIPTLPINLIVDYRESPVIAMTLIQNIVEKDIVKRWTIDLNLGGGITRSTYSNPPLGFVADLEALSAQVLVQYQFSNHWTLGTGLTYLIYSSKSQVNTIETESTFKQDTVAVLNGLNTNEIIEGSREFLTTTNKTHLRYQRTQQLLLPISLRYSASFSKHWDYSLGIGYGFGLWTASKGVIQDPSNQAYDLASDREMRLRSRGSDRLIFDSYLTRKVKNIGQLKFGIQYSHDVNGRYENNNNFQQKNHTLGVSGGIIIPLKF